MVSVPASSVKNLRLGQTNQRLYKFIIDSSPLSIQHLRSKRFSTSTQFSLTNKTDSHNIRKYVLTMVLNTQKPVSCLCIYYNKQR